MVKVYSIIGCGKCVMLKNALNKAEIDYKEAEASDIYSFPVMELEDGTRLDLLQSFNWIKEQNN